MSDDSQEIEEHILEWGPWGHGMKKNNALIVRTSKNICIEFNEKILNGSQEILEHTPKCAQK